MSKLFKVFIAGKYPQGEITEKDLQEIAKNYSPSYHEAPLTLDHKREGSALGWIDSVIAKGKELWVGFSKVSDEAKQLTSEGKYKRPSIEIANYDGMGKYLRAVSLVNFPQVKGLPEMQFNDDDGNEVTIYIPENEKFFTDNGLELKFTESKKSKNKKDMDLKKFAEKLGLNEDATIDEVFAEFEKQLKKKAPKDTEFSELQTELADLKEKLEFYDKEYKKSAKDKASDLIDKAFGEGKVMPEEKAQLLKFAESDYEGTKALLDARRADPLFDKNKVSDTVIDPKSAKFSDGKGGVIKYSDVLKDTGLIAERGLSEKDVEALREKSLFGKK